MSAVLVVSRNTALGLWLSRQEIDVDEGLTAEGPSWPEEVPGHDVVLLDVGAVQAAEQRLKAMVRAGVRVPVLLVGATEPGWEELAGRFSSGLSLLRLPLQPEVVLAELRRLAAGQSLDTVSSTAAVSPAVAPVVAAAAPLVAPAPPVAAGAPEPTPLFDALHGANYEASPVALLPHPTAASHVVSLPVSASLPVAEEVPVRTRASDPVPPEPPPYVPTAVDPVPTPLPVAERDTVLDLVAALQCEIPGLYSVQDVAELVLMDVLKSTGAAAGAALAWNGEAWCVEVAVGLRPLEERLEVLAEHWLIRHVVTEQLGLLVARSDGSHHELLGVPLGSWEHLAAVYLPGSGVLLLLGSVDVPFTEEQLTQVREVDGESTELIRQARAVRDLARALLPFAELDGSPYST